MHDCLLCLHPDHRHPSLQMEGGRIEWTLWEEYHPLSFSDGQFSISITERETGEGALWWHIHSQTVYEYNQWKPHTHAHPQNGITCCCLDFGAISCTISAITAHHNPDSTSLFDYIWKTYLNHFVKEVLTPMWLS